MSILFWLYFTTFCALTVFGAQDSVIDGHSALWILAEVIGSLLAASGMFLYWMRKEIPALRRWWKLVVVFIIAEFVFENGVAFPKMMADADRAVVVISGLFLLLFVAPSFWMNVRYARGHVRRRESDRSLEAGDAEVVSPP